MCCIDTPSEVVACVRELETGEDVKLSNLNWRPERTAHLLDHQAEITVSRDMAHDKFDINAPEFASLDAHTFLVAASRAASRLTSELGTAGIRSPALSFIDGL